MQRSYPNPLPNAWKRELTINFDENDANPVSYTLKNGMVWGAELASLSSLFWHEQSTVLDVGTFCGTYSALAASVTKGKVISVEPDPKNFEFLVKNKEENGFNHQVCYNIAASNQEGEVKFCPNGPSGHILQDGGEEVSITVPAKTLDSVLDGERVDFIKLDVEGWELNVLEGLSQTIDKFSPPIVFEVNGFTLKWFDKTPNDLLRLLEDRFGYQLFAIADGLVPISSFEPFPYGVVDTFAIKACHIQTVAKYITLPLSFSNRKLIYEDSKKRGNSDMQSYFKDYSLKYNI